MPSLYELVFSWFFIAHIGMVIQQWYSTWSMSSIVIPTAEAKMMRHHFTTPVGKSEFSAHCMCVSGTEPGRDRLEMRCAYPYFLYIYSKVGQKPKSFVYAG